jgi:coenzyme F420 hydrogenase subunit beta
MIGRRARSIVEVAERHLCTGCGVCAYLQPNEIHMVDTVEQGRRPLVLAEINGRPANTKSGLQACPGARIVQRTDFPPQHMSELGDIWGPVIEMWEGWAADPELRYQGSSGGAASALALHCLEDRGMHGVLHTAPRTDVPFLNRTVLSTSRAELIAGAGSRYAPASPCERLDLIENANAACVFVGKPCDVAGTVEAVLQRPGLADRLGLMIAVFCGGTPTTAGTFAAIRAAGMNPEDVTEVRYRGRGWPGLFSVTSRSGVTRRLTYEQSWGAILQKHRQWRCMICPDHTGEFADVSVGDPWYRAIEPGEAGRSLVLVRTERGRAAVRSAIAAGHLQLEPVTAGVLPLSQPNLIPLRGAVWGRVTAMAALGMPTPTFYGVPTFPTWRTLPPAEKIRSVLGTMRRVFARRLFRSDPVRPTSAWLAIDPTSGYGDGSVEHPPDPAA